MTSIGSDGRPVRTGDSSIRGDAVHLHLLPQERWWGGCVADGEQMPYGTAPASRDLNVFQGGNNQAAPLLISNKGRYVWSEHPFRFEFAARELRAEGCDLQHGRSGDSLAEAYRYTSGRFFPASGRMPAPEMFDMPQYNTWIEMPYAPTQSAVLAYVQDLLARGLPPGLVMIDDRWSAAYGDWTFDAGRFPNPQEMIDKVHALGCKVMLWLVPYVSPDTEVFRMLDGAEYLVRTVDDVPAIRRWWNGYSAVLDATNKDAVSWLHGRLDELIEEYGVDGFKFDGGDLWSYRSDDLIAEPTDAAGQCQAWAKVGLPFDYNEYRACWKMGGQALAQRLHDKAPQWGALASLIPETIAQGLLGYPFGCPDMIGGGELQDFRQPGFVFDQELFVRYAQCAALFPMMQFSRSPGRVLDSEHLRAVLAALAVRAEHLPDIQRLARSAAGTGEPILRPLAYEFQGMDDITDQFLVGTDLLVAPVLQPGAATRSVLLPPGRWMSWRGQTCRGESTIVAEVDLFALPRFRRLRD